MSFMKSRWWVLGFSFCLVQCSDSKTTTDVFGTMKFSNTTSNDATDTTLSKLVTCKRDVDSKVFEFEAINADASAALKFKVTGFKSSLMETYTCKQADDNRTGSSLGSKFEVCYVQAKVTSSNATLGANTYGMYRDESEKGKDFTYTGTCQIQFSETTPKVKAKIVCSKLIQTVLNGQSRNPISDATTGDVSADVECTP